MRPPLRHTLLAALLILVVVVAGCDFSKRRTQGLIDSLNLDSHDTLYVSFAQAPQSLDWNFSTDRTATVIEENLMEGLTDIEMKGANAEIVPALAEKWESYEGGLKYTFKIRDGLKWTDGELLKAKHFADSIQRLLDSNSPWADSLMILRNAKLYSEKKTKNFGDVGVKAVDDHTLVFSLREPLNYFPGLLAHHSVYPIRKDLIAKFGEDKWWRRENLVTIGSYKFADEQKDKFILLKQNEKFSLHKPFLKNVLLRFGLSPKEELEKFSSGQVNAVVDIPVPDLKYFQNLAELVYEPLLDITYLTFDVRHKPLSNPIFRRLAAMSINREELVEALGGVVKPLAGFIPPGLIGYESNRGVRFDPDMARQVRDHSGYHELSKYSPIYVRVNLPSQSKTAAENVVKQLKQVLNVDFKILGDREEPPKDAPVIFLTHWLASVPDAHDFLKLFTSDSTKNPTGWKNRNYDDFVRQATTAASLDSKEKLYAKAQHILTQTEMPVIPLYLNMQFCLLQKNIQNFPMNVLGLMPFRGVSLE